MSQNTDNHQNSDHHHPEDSHDDHHTEQEDSHLAEQALSELSNDALWILENQIAILATSEETDGQYFLMVEIVGTGTIPHIHTEETEEFYILEGEVSFQVDDQTITASAGELIVVPPGTTHAYQNLGAEPARMLVRASPAELAFFESLVRLTARPGTEPTAPPPAFLDPDALAQVVAAFEENGAIPLNSLIFLNSEYRVSESAK